MYIVLEYLAYIALVSTLGALLFAASAVLLVTQEGAKRVTASSRRSSDQADDLARTDMDPGHSLPPEAPAQSQ